MWGKYEKSNKIKKCQIKLISFDTNNVRNVYYIDLIL